MYGGDGGIDNNYDMMYCSYHCCSDRFSLFIVVSSFAYPHKYLQIHHMRVPSFTSCVMCILHTPGPYLIIRIKKHHIILDKVLQYQQTVTLATRCSF